MRKTSFGQPDGKTPPQDRGCPKLSRNDWPSGLTPNRDNRLAFLCSVIQAKSNLGRGGENPFV